MKEGERERRSSGGDEAAVDRVFVFVDFQKIYIRYGR